MRRGCSCCEEECKVKNKTENEIDNEEEKKLGHIINILGIIMFVLAFYLEKNNYGFIVYLYTLSYLFVGYDIFINSIKRIFKRDMFNENFLMSIAVVGTLLINEYTEGIAVLILYKIGELLQDLAVDKSKEKIEKAINIRAEYANLKVEDDIKKVDPSILKIDDIIVIKNGEKVPVDGVIIEGETEFDTSTLTGESIPKILKIEDKALSGYVNLGNVISVKVTNNYENSTASKIIEMIQTASSKKSKTEKFITRFSKIYTPVVTFMALFILLAFPHLINITFDDALSRALTFLVVSCPCALIISVPLGFFVGIGASSKKGIIVKGSNYLDILTDVKTVVFDKTGTITSGTFNVKNMESISELNESEILEYVAICENYSNHYIAKSILNYYGKSIDNTRIIYHEEIAGKGIKAIVDDKEILVGNASFMLENNIDLVQDIDEITNTIIYLAINNECKGRIILSDEIKKDAFSLADKLRENGVQKIVMLTGDNNISREILDNLGIDEIYKDLLPEDKVKILKNLKADLNKNEKIAFVGDGINDGPVIATSDVGISMGNGSDIAITTSDIVLMTDEPSKVVEAIKIAKNTKKIVIQNISFALFVKIIFLILSGIGILPMWFAVFADVGVSMIAIVNSMRIFKSVK
jgi:Cd2+/Zn2+-exporting ATPase